MNSERKTVAKALRCALSGEGAHAPAETAFEGLEWQLAGGRPQETQHSIFQVLNHLIYWNEWVLDWLDGKKPAIPRHASGSWPGGAAPGDRQEWDQAVERFSKGLQELHRREQDRDLFEKRGKKTPLEMLQTIASHNSYHIGQVVLLRRLVGSWPPPSGGLTW